LHHEHGENAVLTVAATTAVTFMIAQTMRMSAFESIAMGAVMMAMRSMAVAYTSIAVFVMRVVLYASTAAPTDTGGCALQIHHQFFVINCHMQPPFVSIHTYDCHFNKFSY